MSLQSPPDLNRVAQAKERFATWKRQFESGFLVSPPAPLPQRSSARLRIAAGIAAVALLGGLGLWQHTRRSEVEVTAELNGAREFERTLARTPAVLHQVVKVEIIQATPPVRHSQGALEIWSDSARGRYSARWTDRDGTLKYAVWRPSHSARYIYERGRGTLALPVADTGAGVQSLADVAEGEAGFENIEQRLWYWLQSRQWSPVWISSDFALFASKEGVTLRAHKVRGTGGVLLFQLVAEKRIGSGHLEFMLELEAGSHRPRLEEIRFQTTGKTLVMRLRAERAEAVPEHRLQVSVFEPDLSLMTERLPERRLFSRVPGEPRVPAAEHADLYRQEIQVRYALHRTGACLKENLQVIREDSGRVRVRALVESPERRTELLAVLGGLQASELIDREIEVRRPPQWSPAPPAGVSGEGVRAADDAYHHGLALAQLAERYGGRVMLDANSSLLLERMIRDHLAALRLSVARAETLLQPVLDGPVESGAVAVDYPRGSSWADRCFALFRAIDRMDDLVQAMRDPKRGAERQAIAAELRPVLARLEEHFSGVEDSVARQFAANSGENLSNVHPE